MIIATIDFEASSLTGWPIEIGWIRENEAWSKSFLIKRHHSFEMADWSTSSEEIHKISIESLARNGEDPTVVIHAAAKDLENCLVVSNAPSRDGHWLKRLCDAAGVNPPFEITTVTSALEHLSKRAEIPLWLSFDRFHEAGLHEAEPEHRAGSDAARLMRRLMTVTHIS